MKISGIVTIDIGLPLSLIAIGISVLLAGIGAFGYSGNLVKKTSYYFDRHCDD